MCCSWAVKAISRNCSLCLFLQVGRFRGNESGAESTAGFLFHLLSVMNEEGLLPILPQLVPTEMIFRMSDACPSLPPNTGKLKDLIDQNIFLFLNCSFGIH